MNLPERRRGRYDPVHSTFRAALERSDSSSSKRLEHERIAEVRPNAPSRSPFQPSPARHGLSAVLSALTARDDHGTLPLMTSEGV